jgi:hypothetical protein
MNRHSSGQLQTVVGWIFGGSFAFLGLLFVIIGGFEYRQGLKTNDWPAAAGRIVESKIVEKKVDGSSGRRRSRISDRDYTVDVRYSYEVEGQKFEGDRLRYGNESHDSRASAMEEQSLFAPGKEVQVYYDPKTPSQSVLIKGIGLSWLGMVLGLMALVIGLVVMFHMARKKNAKIKLHYA